MKIFVSIASYRDPEILNTVNNLINNAEFPQLLRIVVFEQNKIGDVTIEGKFPEWQVKLLKDHHYNAKGPVWARSIIQKEYKNEEYYLQIDSHSRFVKNWDTKLIHFLNLLPEKSILTQYPPEYDPDDDTLDSDTVRSGLYIQGFGPIDGFTRIQSDYSIQKRHYPYTSRGWSACFSFSKGDIVKEAPYDPNLPFLFFGEELDISLRLYTRGYNFYSPHESVVFTLFKRSDRNTYWEDIPKLDREKQEETSRERLWFKILKNIDMGKERSIEDYEKFADIQSIVDNRLLSTAKSFRRKCTKKLYR